MMSNPNFTLSTKRATLSLLKPQDFDDVLRLFQEPETFKYIAPLANLSTQEYLKFLNKKLSDIHSKKGYYWICRTEEGALIGCINLTPIPSTPERLQIGWQISEKFQKKGFASELSGMVFQFAIENLQISQIYGVTESENVASIKILGKLGFEQFEVKEENGKKMLIYRFARKS